MASMIIPPGGLAGFSQMAPASQLALTQGAPRATGTRRRRKRKAKNGHRAKRRSGGRKGRKMKFGSPAWQKKYRVGKYAKKK